MNTPSPHTTPAPDSATPRTDAAIDRFADDCSTLALGDSPDVQPLFDFARTLERELAAGRQASLDAMVELDALRAELDLAKRDKAALTTAPVVPKQNLGNGAQVPRNGNVLNNQNPAP